MSVSDLTKDDVINDISKIATANMLRRGVSPEAIRTASAKAVNDVWGAFDRSGLSSDNVETIVSTSRSLYAECLVLRDKIIGRDWASAV